MARKVMLAVKQRDTLTRREAEQRDSSSTGPAETGSLNVRLLSDAYRPHNIFPSDLKDVDYGMDAGKC